MTCSPPSRRPRVLNAERVRFEVKGGDHRLIVWVYEERKLPIPEMDPIDFLKAHMEMTDRTQADLAALLDSRSRASEVLNRKRALTVDMIHKLSRERGVPSDPLVRPYHLAA
jgi:HTH-type transcriptional regulator / antitoxin HigA